MRLLWLSHLLPHPPKGGVLQRSHHLLREAAERHEVDLVALVQPAHQGSEEERAEAEAALGAFCRDVQSFWIGSDRRAWGRPLLLARTLLSRRPYDVNWLDEPSLWTHLRERKTDHDLVHVDTVGLAPYTEAVPDTPFVLNHHNVESQMMADRARQQSNSAKRLYMRREAGKLAAWERDWAGRAAVNLVVSPLDRERLRERADDARVEVVENGVDVDYFRPRTPAEEHDGHVVFVGGMSWYPNRDAMLWFVDEIWPRLREAMPGLRAEIIGRDPPEEVRAAARDGQLRAPGFVDDIRPTVDRALAYVCPIREGGGTRLKVLDALAMAKPLVATAFAVEGLGLEEGTHYLRAETPEEYVAQVRRLAEDPALRRGLAEAGRELVARRYAWSVVGENLERAYRSALEA